MDSLEQFSAKLANEFEDLEPGSISGNTQFRSLPNWSSMHALIIIALVDTEYGVKIKGDDIKNSNTINDIYSIVVSRKA